MENHKKRLIYKQGRSQDFRAVELIPRSIPVYKLFCGQQISMVMEIGRLHLNLENVELFMLGNEKGRGRLNLENVELFKLGKEKGRGFQPSTLWFPMREVESPAFSLPSLPHNSKSKYIGNVVVCLKKKLMYCCQRLKGTLLWWNAVQISTCA